MGSYKTLFIAILLILVGFINLKAQPSFDWALKFGGDYNDIGNSIAVDNNGNVYTSGYFADTVDFDPGPGTFNLSSTGTTFDMFVSKVDSSGNFLWAISFGNSSGSSDTPLSITTDKNNNLYLTSSFSNIMDFDPGPSVFNLTSTAGGLFICKLNSSGNFIWVRQFGGGSTPYSRSIKVDKNGNVYTTGQFSGPVDFDPGPGTYNLTGLGWDDAFVSKLDSSGNFIWAKNIAAPYGFQTSDYARGQAIDVDKNGNVYTIGTFRDTVDFDPGINTHNLYAWSHNIFISKLDASGNFVWAKQFDCPSFIYPGSISVDRYGNIYSTGGFEGITDFDPSSNTFNLTPVQNRDAFICKLDTSGNFIWAKQFGGSSTVMANSISNDSLGNVYTTGHFRSTTDFAPGPAIYNLTTSLGNEEIFISKLDSAGNFVWAKQLGYYSPFNPAGEDDRGHDLSLDNIGNIYTTGFFKGTADFDPDTSVFNLTSNGYKDIYVHKMSSCFNSSTSNVSLTICDNYTSPSGNHNWTTSGYYFDIIPNSEGCDSVILFDLTIINSDITIDNRFTCDSLLWIDGNIYTPPNNTAVHTITGAAANGCDSIITLNLNFSTSHGTDFRNTCESLLWIDGNVYTNSNFTATHTIIGGAANNCDSIVHLFLTINNIDTSVTDGSPILFANANNSTYQWLNCGSNFSIINGEINQYYLATANGTYAVEVTNNGCTDTSSCYTVTNVGIIENNFDNDFLVYPNPTSNQLAIDTELKISTIKIIDISGKTIKTITTDLSIVNVADLSDGIYFIQLITKERTITKKFVKQ